MNQYATYCPEDNKLRLYVGRVPRDEYLKLRDEGWTSTPKQECNFVATWTPERRDTAEHYGGGIILDEDQSPEERAADRAERFGVYRDKRHAEATGHADKYDAGPAVHGYQSQARADKAAARHDRIADRASDSWSKAEYWTRRTAGVISHALHKSSPAVRMGRIKEIEADLRKQEKGLQDQRDRRAAWLRVAAMNDPEKQTKLAYALAGQVHWSKYKHPRNGREGELYMLLPNQFEDSPGYTDPITGAEAAALYLSDHEEPPTDTDWTTHLKLRLAYENQMLEAQGGRAAFVEMEPGGWIGSYQIRKVNKSNATGRVVSVAVMHEKGKTGYTRESGYTKYEERPGLVVLNIERLKVDSYRPPTEEDKKKLAETIKAEKAAAPAKEPCPLINPTDEDAERLQKLIVERWRERYKANGYTAPNKDPEAFKVCPTTQARYSAASAGTYNSAETRGVCYDAELTDAESNMWSSEREKRRARIGNPVCKVRVTGWDPPRVVVLKDKPQKPFPAKVWEKKPETAPAPAELETA